MSETTVLSEAERLAWIRLARTDAIGASTFARLRARFPDIREALEAAPNFARRGGGSLVIPPEDEIHAELENLARIGGRILLACDEDFPAGLAALDAPPPLISVLGRSDVLRRDMVAIVGARNASALGIAFAARIATALGAAGLAIASGLARGIDTAAHKGSLETGTIAVLAGGVDVCYPPENRALYDMLREKGAIISEMKLSTQVLPRLFPRRNRIISGLARGVVVVEAAERSGSLITARYALEQGREIFAVPGSPLDARAKGCNQLIRDGAQLLESADDVLQTLAPILGKVFHAAEEAGSEPQLARDCDTNQIRELIAEKLGPAPVDVDELIRQCGAQAEAVLTALLELELAGHVDRQPGNRVAWRGR